MTMLTTAEMFFVVPHLHDRADNSFSLSVGLRVIHKGEFLPNTVSLAGLKKLMAVVSSIFLSIIRIGVIDLIRKSSTT